MSSSTKKEYSDKEIKELFINYLDKKNQEIESLKDRLKKASFIVRKYTYSITSEKERTTKVELIDDSLDELMSQLEWSDDKCVKKEHIIKN